MSEADIRVTINKKYSNKDILIEPCFTNGTEEYAVARILQHPTKTTTTCRILNFQNKPLVFCRRQNIASVSSVDVNTECQKLNSDLNQKRSQNFENLTPEQQQNFISDYGFNINKDLPKEQYDEFIKIMYHYRDTFARSITELKVHQGYAAELDIIDKKPFMQRQYKLPKDHEIEVENQVDQLLAANLMEEAEDSNYSVPYYCIKKKGTNQLRLILDLRKSNSVCATRLFPLPTIDNVIQEVAGSSSDLYSSFDMASGFYQIPLKQW